ncbi:hypothetical protein ACKS0A_05597 [Histoplasma ohiense]
MVFMIWRISPHSIPTGREEEFGTNSVLAIGVNIIFIRQRVRNVVRFRLFVIVQASKPNVLLSVRIVTLEGAASNHSQTGRKRMDFLFRLVPLKVVPTGSQR